MNTEALDDGDVEFSAADRWIRSRLDATTREMHKHLAPIASILPRRRFTSSPGTSSATGTSNCRSRSCRRTNVSRTAARHPQDADRRARGLAAPAAPADAVHHRRNLGTGCGTCRYRWRDDHAAALPRGLRRCATTMPVADIEWVKQFVLGIRQIRGEMDISPGKPLPVVLQHASASDRRRAANARPPAAACRARRGDLGAGGWRQNRRRRPPRCSVTCACSCQ